MKKALVGALIGLMAGSMIGFALGIFIYPFWFLREVATEQLAADGGRRQLGQGTFIHVNPADPVHWGSGRVGVFADEQGRSVVFLHEDFEVGPGPRFHVYLVAGRDIRSRADFLASEKVDLGRLRAFKGSQVYPVPAEVDPLRYGSVVIWCKEFSVLISPANLVGSHTAWRQ